MSPTHSVSFVSDVLGKLGAPIFSATLVGCLLRDEVSLMHGVLLAVGTALLAFGHWRDHHRG